MHTVHGKALIKAHKTALTRLKDFIYSLLKQLQDGLNLAIFAVVVVVLYMPCWLCLVLSFVWDNAILTTIATVYAAFWAGPGTPFFPLCIGLTVGIRKIINKVRKRDKSAKKDNRE